MKQGIKNAKKVYNVSTVDNWLSELAQAYAKQENLVKTWDIICQLRNMGLNLKPYPLMFCLKHLGHTKDGLRAFTELVQVMKREGNPPSRIILSYFISLCRELGDVAGIEMWLEEMREQKFTLSIMDYMHLIKASLNLNNYEKAEEFLKRMKEDGVTPDAGIYATFIQIFLKNGDLEKANSWMQKMKQNDANLKLKGSVFESFILALIKNGEMKLAEEWWKEAFLSGDGTFYPFKMMLREYLRKGKRENANELISFIENSGTKPTPEIYELLKSVKESGEL